MKRPVLETEISLTVFWVRDIRFSNHFYFAAAFPSWTTRHNELYLQNMVKGFGRDNVKYRVVKRKAAN